jgi:hypothetical protein
MLALNSKWQQFLCFVITFFICLLVTFNAFKLCLAYAGFQVEPPKYPHLDLALARRNARLSSVLMNHNLISSYYTTYQSIEAFPAPLWGANIVQTSR